MLIKENNLHVITSPPFRFETLTTALLILCKYEVHDSMSYGCFDVVKVEMRNVLPADKSSLKNNEFEIIRCNTLVFTNIGSTVQSGFSNIKFSDNLWFSDYFTNTVFSIYHIKSFDFVISCNLVTVFAETKNVTKSRLHCIAIWRIYAILDSNFCLRTLIMFYEQHSAI